MPERRWDPCVSHRDTDVDVFVREFLSHRDRQVLLIAGAGFDPRSTTVATRLAKAGTNLRGVLIQEVRPRPTGMLVRTADANAVTLRTSLPDSAVFAVDIFGPDGAVVGGRNAVSVLARLDLNGVTDVAVDISALSVGVSFPMIRFLVEQVEAGQLKANLHLFVAHDPKLDAEIRSHPGDSPGYVHGFRGGATLDALSGAAKLWLPQLAKGRRGTLIRLHAFVSPHDTCPILPFPASDPRLGDCLAEEYLIELESTWEVDARNIVYADEGDPLDLYRTILTMDDLRKPVFAEVGGSLLVLSPAGSKVMALGALMAALERDLPVAYLEALSYDYDPKAPGDVPPNLVHIWLEGDAYPKPRRALQPVRKALA